MSLSVEQHRQQVAQRIAAAHRAVFAPAAVRYACYQLDPVGYANNVLGFRLTADQEAMLRSVVVNRYTAVKASHAVGKTFCAAILACWWFDCWAENIVYITAPTWKQALGLTFKAVKTTRRQNKLPGRILDSGIVRDTDEILADSHYIQALNAESGEGFQGEHSAPILIILEEAVGVPKYIWEASGGLMTNPDCRLFAIANPTDEASIFGQYCELPSYNVISISALNHPNITAELRCSPPPFPKAVRLLWLYEELVKECDVVGALTEHSFEFYALEAIKAALDGTPLDESQTCYYLPSGYFQGRVLGEFPTQADDKVIPRGWITNLPKLEYRSSDDVEIGCDTAWMGDDRSTVIGRIGACAIFAKELRKMDSLIVAEAVKEVAKDLSKITNIPAKKIRIKIDVTGGMGTGPHDILKADGYTVFAISAAAKAIDEEKYPNRRSEFYFDIRDRAKDKRLDLSRLPKDIRQKLIRELSTPKYKVRSGRKVVEEKSEIKKRLGYSPDLADGFNLAFAPAPKAASKPAVGGTRQVQRNFKVY